ncbi:MAG: gamma-glutamylcyclotransferase [Myxococcota bacterium]
MTTTLDVFAYGSLMSEPAAPDHLVGRSTAVLLGWRRVFQQLSRTRGCPADAAPPGEPAISGFIGDHGVRFSLALGLVEDPESEVVGVCLHYDLAHQDAVMSELQRREGPGYEARKLQVNAIADAGVPWTAWTWVSRIGHPRVLDLSIAEQAKVLRAGTPTRDIDGRARGVHYLYDVVEALDELGMPDPNLAELVDRCRGGDEPLPPG